MLNAILQRDLENEQFLRLLWTFFRCYLFFYPGAPFCEQNHLTLPPSASRDVTNTTAKVIGERGAWAYGYLIGSERLPIEWG
jgi:hypothetical protein